MSRAALRSTLVLAGVTGLLGTGLLQVAGATESWQLSADGTTATYSSVDTGSELPLLVPAGVTSLDVAVLSGEQGTEDAAPAPQQIAVLPGSSLVFDLGHDDELLPSVTPAPADSADTAPSEPPEALEETAPASWYIAPGNGAAASIRIADPAELVVAEQDTPAAEGRVPDSGTAIPVEDVPAGTSSASTVPTDGLAPEVPTEVPTDVPGRDNGVVAQDRGGDDAPVTVVVSFTVPTPGVLPAELQAPEWLAPADPATVDEPAVRDEGTGAAEDTLPVEPSTPSGFPAPADVLTPADAPAPVETPPNSEAPSEIPAPVEAPAAVETPAPEDVPAQVEVAVLTEAPAPSETPEPVEALAQVEAPAAGEGQAPTETPEPVDAPAPAETSAAAEEQAPTEIPEPVGAPAPSEAAEATPPPAPADTHSAGAPAAPTGTASPASAPAAAEVQVPAETAVVTAIAAESVAPVAVEATAEVIPPQPTVLTASVPDPTSAPRRTSTPAASPSPVPAEPSAAAQSADAPPAVDLQTASSMVPADLFDADGVGMLTAALVGVVVLGVSVTVVVGVRRRD